MARCNTQSTENGEPKRSLSGNEIGERVRDKLITVPLRRDSPRNPNEFQCLTNDPGLLDWIHYWFVKRFEKPPRVSPPPFLSVKLKSGRNHLKVRHKVLPEQSKHADSALPRPRVPEAEFITPERARGIQKEARNGKTKKKKRNRVRSYGGNLIGMGISRGDTRSAPSPPVR